MYRVDLSSDFNTTVNQVLHFVNKKLFCVQY